MTSGRQLGRQFETAAGDPRALDLPAPDLRTIGGGHDSRPALPALEVHGPDQPRAEVARGDVQVDADPRPVRRGDDGQERAPAIDGEPAQLGGERRRIVHRAAHGAQDVDLGFQREVAQLAAVVVIGVADAAQPSQSIDQGRIQGSTLQKSGTARSQAETPRRPRAPAPPWSCSPCRTGASTGCRRAAPAMRRSAPSRRRSAGAATAPPNRRAFRTRCRACAGSRRASHPASFPSRARAARSHL